MPIPIPQSLVDFILLGPVDDRRQLQEGPILGDVWIAFANKPGQRQDLLIEPYLTEPAGRVATALDDRITEAEEEANIAYLQGIIAARLTFEEVLRHVVPMTYWWKDQGIADKLKAYDVAQIAELVDSLIASARFWEGNLGQPPQEPPPAQSVTPLDRYVVVTGVILWAASEPSEPPPTLGALLELISGREVADRLLALFGTIEPAPPSLVWQVSLNRRATPALERSVPAVKADAARTLFSVRCDKIAWAVLDSGIDATHPVFRDKDGASRVVKSYDFSAIRQIISLDNRRSPVLERRLDTLLHGALVAQMGRDEASRYLKELAEDARKGRAVDWELVEKFIEVSNTTPPYAGHGTHVAGIIGANKDCGEPGFSDGMCPDIKLYDLRILARTASDTEFAVIAALQYLRHLNERGGFMSVHGANLSLSIPHDVRNFACGRTPVCDECERLIESGVVVVAAAGNRGYQSFETREGLFEGYAAFSLTDPGNADGVITVGATHRYWPHTYGVSFFSSRGPTGDGRIKPDLVAPGERIQGPLPNKGWGQQDGTSMAAPHVSGAAAMLMARYSELIGQPRRIKRIICDAATDLGRERSFQGCGMLDVLRAFQGI